MTKRYLRCNNIDSLLTGYPSRDNDAVSALLLAGTDTLATMALPGETMVPTAQFSCVAISLGTLPGPAYGNI